MSPKTQLLLQRAINEIKVSKLITELSNNPLSQEELGIKNAETYYSAKAYLIQKNIETKPPEEHKKVYEHFKELIHSGQIDVELFKIYESVLIKADSLLEILQLEKRKRGKFTYQKLPQANREPAIESKNNAELFFKHINSLCDT